MLTSRLLLGNWWDVTLNWTELQTAGDNALYAAAWPHLIGWGHSTYYNRCYTIEGRGHLYHKINTKIETILLHAQGPKRDRTQTVHVRGLIQVLHSLERK